MKTETCSSVLRGLRAIRMNERDRARAENGVRRSAAIIELFVGMAEYVGFRSRPEISH